MTEDTTKTKSGWHANRWLWTAAALGVAAVFVPDPVHCRFYPTCLFHNLTGLNCPGCGASRAAYQLLHGHLVTAFHDNPLFVVSMPLLAVYLAWKRFGNGHSALAVDKRTHRWLWVGFGVVVLFGILRNLPYPAFRWMSP